MLKEEFYEDYNSSYYTARPLDPLAPPTEMEFDWDELYERLGEPSDRQLHENNMEQISEFVRKLFQWVVAVDLKQPNSQMLVGRRFIALAWVLNPALFDGSPSASKLAETLGITRKANLWTLTGEASQHFGITNRSQSHGWNRGKQNDGIATSKGIAKPQQNDSKANGTAMTEPVPTCVEANCEPLK